MDYKPTILLVDDDVNILNALSSILHKTYRVLTALNAEDAYSILNNNPEVLAIISDYMMPDRTGLELFASLRNMPHLFKVLITGFRDFNIAVEAINVAKVDYFLTKPINFNELVKILDDSVHARALTTLTTKERQIVSLLTTGLSSQEIAHLLRISPVTLSVHKGNILKKLKMDRDKVFLSILTGKVTAGR